MPAAAKIREGGVQDRVERVAALSVDGLRKSYGSVRALDGVSLEVRTGEFVALLGPNGAGKSTLLQVLTGLFAPDAGTVSILGEDIRTHLVQGLARLGVVFQQPTLDLELTVEANLHYHADLHGLPRALARKRIGELLERFGLADRRRDRARALSGGNRRRLELARALLHEPKLLLMDEATVGLDPASRKDILDRILTMTRAGEIGVLWTTHLVDEVEDADRVIVLHRGRALFQGSPAELRKEAQAETIGAAFLKLTGATELVSLEALESVDAHR
jgi:ABC-2 type transport system ATP-binding protein